MLKNNTIQRCFRMCGIFSIFSCFIFSVFFVDAQPPGSGSTATKEKAVVFVDPANKKNISGYAHITYATGARIKSPRDIGSGLINLKEAMLKWTQLETIVDQQVRLSSPEIMKCPFVYIAFEGGFDLTESEKSNLKNYLSHGGFIVLEQLALAKEQSASGSAYSRMISDILGSQARVAPIANSHKLYHCFFDFTDGPPIGGELKEQRVGRRYSPSGNESPISISGKDVNYLESITMDGRIVGICSSKRYLDKWKERGNNEPQLRMGVNMIVFALTQSGGLAAQ